MLKKLLCAALAVLMILSLAGCRNTETAVSTNEVSSAASEESVSSEAESQESTASAEEVTCELKEGVLFAPPVEGLAWGMPLDEVEAVLTEAGVTDPKLQESDATAVLTLTAAHMKQLGLETVDTLKTGGGNLQFQMDTSGVKRLTAATVNTYIPSTASALTMDIAKDALRDTLCPLYGAAVETAGSLGMESLTWGMHGKTLTEEEAALLPEAALKTLQDNDYDAFGVYPQLTVSLMEPVQPRITLLYAGAAYVFLQYEYEF